MFKGTTSGILALVMAAFTAGCATTWAPNSLSTSHPQWSGPSQALLVRHTETITGFKRTGTSFSSVMRYIVFGGSTSETQFVQPVAVAVGSDGRIAVADIGRACVHLYIPSEKAYLMVASAKGAALRTPVGVAFDDDLQLYVSDSTTGAVHVFDRSGAFLRSLRSAGPQPLVRPTGLAWSPTTKLLYVTDTVAGRLYGLTPAGELRLAAGGVGEETGRFNFPTHVAVAPNGDLFVVDAMNFRVQILDPLGSFRSSFGHHGNGSGDLAMPKGIAVDRSGVVYLADTLFDTVQFFDRKGDFLYTIGGRGADQGQFIMPSGIFLDAGNRLYVCDSYNRRVQIFQLMGEQRP